MKGIDNKRFRMALANLAGTYRTKLSEPEIQQCWESLNRSKIQIADFEWCVKRIIDGEYHKTDFMPTVPSLCRYAKQAAKEYRKNAPVIRVDCNRCNQMGFLWAKQKWSRIYGNDAAPVKTAVPCICGNAPPETDEMPNYKTLIERGWAASEDFERIDHARSLVDL